MVTEGNKKSKKVTDATFIKSTGGS